RRHLGQYLQQVRSVVALRRIQRERFRPRRREARPLRVRGARRMTTRSENTAKASKSEGAMTTANGASADTLAEVAFDVAFQVPERLRVNKAYKMFVGGAFV